jgi:NADH dehydrogenase FAD-containing subunit
MVGAGHAQLFLLEGLAQGTVRASEPVLISARRSHGYSGMVPGWLAGQFEEAALFIDLAALAARAGCQFVEGEVRRIDAAARTLELADGRSESWEVLSLAIGSVAGGQEVPGAADIALTLRPIGRAREILPALERARERRGDGPVRIAVVGAGAASFEVACALRARLHRDGLRGTITLVDAGPELLADRHPSTRAAGARVLTRLGIGTALGARVTEVSARGLATAAGAFIPADAVVWTAGAAPSPILAAAGLTLDGDGFVLVDDHLRSVSHPDVLVAGDAAALQHHPATPKSRVHAVQEGPVLRHNVAALCDDAESRRLRRYEPQPRFLALLNCGDGTALFSYGSLALEGRWALCLKEAIDRRFVTRFQRLAGAT